MAKDDTAYFRSRAEAEFERALAAKHEKASAAHREMAGRYLGLIEADEESEGTEA